MDSTPTVARLELDTVLDTLRSIAPSANLTVRLFDEHGAPVAHAVQWASSVPAIVSVQPGGRITAMANGEADVVASTDGAADTARIVVRQVATTIAISGVDSVFAPGVRTRFTATVADSLGSAYVLESSLWSSDARRRDGAVRPRSTDRGGHGPDHDRCRCMDAWRDLTVVPLIELEVPATLAESFQWALEDSAAANGVVGSSAAVPVPGVGTWRGVVGRSDETEVIRPEMLFYPGSIVKTIVSAATLSLVDEGILTLEDSIGQWLAPFDNPYISPGISLRHLLQNTSRLYPYASHPSIGDSRSADLERGWTPREAMERFVLAWSTPRPPSTEESHRPIAAAWFGGFGGPLQSAADLMTPAAHTLLWLQPLVGADALTAFARALFGDFLGPGVRTEMLRAVSDDGAIPHQIAGGLGVRKYDYLGRTQWGHSGSQGAGSGFVVWDEDSGVVVSLLYNQSGASHSGSHFRLMPRMLQIALDAIRG